MLLLISFFSFFFLVSFSIIIIAIIVIATLAMFGVEMAGEKEIRIPEMERVEQSASDFDNHILSQHPTRFHFDS